MGRATRLIGELRDSNYELTGEVATLKRKLEALEGARGPERSRPEETIAVLRDERQAIRSRVKALLERIEEIESRL